MNTQLSIISSLIFPAIFELVKMYVHSATTNGATKTMKPSKLLFHF